MHPSATNVRLDMTIPGCRIANSQKLMSTTTQADKPTGVKRKRNSVTAEKAGTGRDLARGDEAINSGKATTNRQRFLDACHCRAVDHPPVWLMRQAGRALPEYRALKDKYSFLELVRTPELASEVTLQPVRRFDFDAAILFSDILVTAEGLGQGYRFSDGEGIQMDFLIQSTADIARLEPEKVTQRLQYMAQALRMVNSTLGNRTPLLSFSVSPSTPANVM